MTTITIVPENFGSSTISYRAVSGQYQSVGPTAGQALDALTAQFNGNQDSTLVVIQNMRPDELFDEGSRTKLVDLMERWRRARDNQTNLATAEQAELEQLVAAEYRAAVERAEQLLREKK